MKIYQRNIFLKLICIRVIFITLLALTIFLFFTSISNYSILTIIALLTISCFPVFDIIIFDNGFEIKKYYISGIIPMSWKCSITDRFDIYSTEVFRENLANDILLEPSPWFFNLFSGQNSSFSYKSSIIKIFYKEKKIKKIIEKLSDKEYELLFEFYLKQKRIQS